MPTIHIFDNFLATSFEPVTAGSAFEAGPSFVTPTGGNITALRWYRTGAGDTAPSFLRVWDTVTHLVVASAPTIPDSAGAGWKQVALPANVPLVPGRVYVVAIGYTGAQTSGRYTLGTVPVVPYPLAFGSTLRQWNNGSTGYPAGGDNTFLHPADVAVEAGVIIVAAPGTPGDLADWLDTAVGTQAHSAPLATQALASGSSGFAAIKALADLWNSGLGAGATGYFAFMKTALLAVKERTDRLPDSIEALTNAILDAGVAETEAIQANLALIQAGVDALTGGSGGTAGGALGALSGRSAFPATGWSLADETDWDTDLAWPVPADLYVCTVTTPPPGAAADSFAGVTWYHRLGSWTVLDGDQAGARAFIEFSPQQLQDGGRRMPGLALRTKNGTLGHMQAWLLA
jgi:hypothetical protein